jgi:hypothetical protein
MGLAELADKGEALFQELPMTVDAVPMSWRSSCILGGGCGRSDHTRRLCGSRAWCPTQGSCARDARAGDGPKAAFRSSAPLSSRTYT